MKIAPLRGALAACVLAAGVITPNALAFQVLPRISDTDRKLSSLGSNGFTNTLGLWFVNDGLPMIKSPVTRAFVALWREGADWAEAGKYFECAFAIEDAAVQAGAWPFK